MSDFKERLEQRKRELLQEKHGISVNQPTYVSRPTSFIDELKPKVLTALIFSSLFILLFTYTLFKDWWGFVGSPEYSQYKQRVYRE